MRDEITRINAALAGRYALEGEIGAGGMATVYLAEDLRHGRKVALKVLKADLAAVVGGKRFVTEIRTTANLQHPNILPLHDSGEAGGLLYYVMPFVEGESLRQRLDRERQLSVEDAVGIAGSLAAALDYAHGRGVIHRDIKPANILIQAGEPVLADFGIALAVEGAGGDRLTETGLSVGTPHYMSPEQATGDRELGPASDIYALGAVAYEMLAGAPPFSGTSRQAVWARVMADTPDPVTTHRPRVPPNVDAAIRRALEKVPADRFPSAGAFAAALRDPDYRDPSADGRPRRAGLWNPLSVGMTAVAGGMAALLLMSAGDPPVPTQPTTRYALSLGQIPAVPVNYGSGLAVSPDGSRLAYRGRSQEGPPRIFVKSASELEARPVEALGGELNLTFSPDGDFLAAAAYRQDGLAVVSLETGEVIQLAETGIWAGGIDWGPDGWIYVQGDGGTLVRVSSDTGERQELTTLAPGEVEHVNPVILPGGRGLVFTVWHASPDFDRARIAAIDLATGEQTGLTTGNRALYSETGHLIVVRSDGSVHAAPFDVDRLALTGEVAHLFDGVAVGGLAGFDIDLSRSGDLVYAGSGLGATDRSLVWVDREGGEEALDPSWVASFWDVALSPDGERLAVMVRGTGSSIWTKSLDGGPPTSVTEGTTYRYDRDPVWMNGGDSILFIGDVDGTDGVYALRSDGLGSPQPRTTDAIPGLGDIAGSTRTGWYLYRAAVDEEDADVFAMPLDGGGPPLRVATRERVPEYAPSLSPDGRYVAYVSGLREASQLWVRTFPDVEAGAWLVATGAHEPLWSATGDELFYRTSTHLFAASVQADPAFRVLRTDSLFRTTGFVLRRAAPAYDVGADGRFLMVRELGTDVLDLVVVDNFAEELRSRIPDR